MALFLSDRVSKTRMYLNALYLDTLIDYLGVRGERNSILEYCTVYAAVHQNIKLTRYWIDPEMNNYINMFESPEANPSRPDRLDMNALSKQRLALEEGCVDRFLECPLEFF